jgi:hypothetical protein
MDLVSGFINFMFWGLKVIVIILYLSYQYWYIAIPLWILIFYLVTVIFPNGFVSGSGSSSSGVYTVTTFGDKDNFSRTKVRIDNSPN